MYLRCNEAQAHLQESKQEFDALSPRFSPIIIPVCRSLFLKRGELKHQPLQTIVVCKKAGTKCSCIAGSCRLC